MIDILWTKWCQFADLTYDPIFLRKLRRGVGYLALTVTIGWFISCTVLGILASNARGQEPTRSEEAYYTLYFPLVMKDIEEKGGYR